MMTKGKPDCSVEMLMLLVVLTLVPTWSDGLVLKKCELRSQLEAAFSELLPEKAAEIVAKLACTVEQTSGFNTSLVDITYQYDPRFSGMGELPLKSNEMFHPERAEVQPEKSVDHVDRKSRKKKDASNNDEIETDQSEETQENNGLYGTVIPQTSEPDPTDIYYDTYEMLFGSTFKPNDRTEDTEARMKRSPHISEDLTTLYGIFQLSDIACNSGASNGLCGLECSALTDDDITDDIACLMIMYEKGRMMGFTRKCASVEPSHYFAECG
ncbi:uncharacterized protein wu:fj19g03 [Tachysurus fulvidraco]|uniref:uncharacterized protein wu:fj19g03 n=1 Tax=Tachysurus fulvidraco TaxID=1234273 RepID=UPI001FF04600|nr:uncharacterized protein wu:fj19g03 [Tachysurus fulvidraco]